MSLCALIFLISMSNTVIKKEYDISILVHEICQTTAAICYWCYPWLFSETQPNRQWFCKHRPKHGWRKRGWFGMADSMKITISSREALGDEMKSGYRVLFNSIKNSRCLRLKWRQQISTLQHLYIAPGPIFTKWKNIITPGLVKT